MTTASPHLSPSNQPTGWETAQIWRSAKARGLPSVMPRGEDRAVSQRYESQSGRIVRLHRPEAAGRLIRPGSVFAELDVQDTLVEGESRKGGAPPESESSSNFGSSSTLWSPKCWRNSGVVA